MQNIVYKITVGNTTLRTGTASRLLRLVTRAALAVPVHSCQLTVEAGVPLDIQPDAAVQIELGDNEELHQVFTGRMSRLQTSITTIQLEAFSSFSHLTRAHINGVYEKQSAGEIVDDLLGKLNVKKGKVEAGVQFATYTVSARHTAWAELHTLAQKCGFVLYADTADRAIFGKYQPGKTQRCHYGVHLLDYTWENRALPFDGVEIYGESPVGQGQSDEATAWLTKKEVKGAAGQTTGNVLRRVDATARTQNLARTLADNYRQGYQRQACGHVRLLGAPQVRLGDGLELAQMPVAAHNGLLHVTGVSHHLSITHGFVTEVSWEKV